MLSRLIASSESGGIPFGIRSAAAFEFSIDLLSGQAFLWRRGLETIEVSLDNLIDAQPLLLGFSEQTRFEIRRKVKIDCHLLTSLIHRTGENYDPRGNAQCSRYISGNIPGLRVT